MNRCSGVYWVAFVVATTTSAFQVNNLQQHGPRKCPVMKPKASTRSQARSLLSPQHMRDDQGASMVCLNLMDSTEILLSEAISTAELTSGVDQAATPLSDTTNILVFVAGIFPFAWATVEFWRRIAVGESFGTGSDSIVIIGEDDAPESSRGQRVLGKGALVVAYILFTISAATIGVVLYSVLTSPSSPPPSELLQ